MLTRSRWRGWITLCSHTSIRHKTMMPTSHLITEYKVKEKSQKKSAQHFVDYKRVVVQAGDGGNGCVSFLSLFANEFAGPDGGNGGNGGHIIFKADNNVRSLAHFKSQHQAESGRSGRNKKCDGRNGEHLVMKVPEGTLVKNDDFEQLADLQKDGDLYVAARGGGGGKGNRYYMSADNTTPTSYEEGGKGQERRLHVELRVIAHVGLVGFPNAGKSTLLRALSRARPKVASYAFTTLQPHIGIIEYKDCQQVAVADIPGLIPGAHQNHGLGFSFLKHIERCVCLLYVIDLAAEDPIQQLESLKFELEQFEPGLSTRPHAIIGNKIDLVPSKENWSKLQTGAGDLTLFAISAKHKVDIAPLFVHIRDLYDRYHLER